MAINVQLLKSYMRNNFNVLIVGVAGTGKTAMLREAAKQLGLKMVYVEASKIDPFTDLIGIPVPQNDTKTIEYYRPSWLDEAEVLFIDEINRAGDPRILNALFEIVQFRTINGVPLPKLKCVVAAMNPESEEYTVEALDHAFLDRFDMFLTAEPAIDYAYFSSRFNSAAATVVAQWWKNYHEGYLESKKKGNAPQGYISPRRMEKVAAAFQCVPELSTIKNAMPPTVITADYNLLYAGLKAAFSTASKGEVDSSANKYGKLFTLSDEKLRSQANADLLMAALMDKDFDADSKNRLLSQLTIALRENMGITRMMTIYGSAINMMSPMQKKQLLMTWPAAKKREFADAYSAFLASKDEGSNNTSL